MKYTTYWLRWVKDEHILLVAVAGRKVTCIPEIGVDVGCNSVTLRVQVLPYFHRVTRLALVEELIHWRLNQKGIFSCVYIYVT